MDEVAFSGPLGEMVGALDGDGAVVRLEFRPRGAGRAKPSGSAAGERLLRQLAEYFRGERREFDLPLAPQGTAFQQAVWRELVKVPFGHRTTYAEIAQRVGRPDAARAVGAANGANPIAVVIPCHRVVGSDGSLTGYGAGLPVKRWLLEHEAGARPLPFPARS
jgi:methylated-DNA-[protein]-cysteine S-methyltransferase